MIKELFVQNVQAFEKEIARLNRRATRIGVPLIVVQNLGKVTKTRTIVETCEGRVCDQRSVPVEVVHYSVTVPDAADRTWTPCAKITPVEDSKPFVERLAPGFDLTPWENADPCHCDHCKVDRNRVFSYVVRNEQTGAVLQLGRNCFADYVGKDTLAALEFVNFVQNELFGDEEGFFPAGRSALRAIEVRYVIALAESLYLAEGWFNNTKQAGYVVKNGTHRVVANFVRRDEYRRNDRTPDEHSEAARKALWDIEGNKNHPAWEAADKILFALRETEIDADDEFGQSIKNLVDYSFVPTVKAGLVAYAGQYLRNLVERRARAAKLAEKIANAKHVGTVGKREIFKGLTCRKSIGIETTFGILNINIFEDENGNTLVWKTNSASFGEGDKVSLKATVKEHGERNGVPQTILTRCKELETV